MEKVQEVRGTVRFLIEAISHFYGAVFLLWKAAFLLVHTLQAV